VILLEHVQGNRTIAKRWDRFFQPVSVAVKAVMRARCCACGTHYFLINLGLFWHFSCFREETGWKSQAGNFCHGPTVAPEVEWHSTRRLVSNGSDAFEFFKINSRVCFLFPVNKTVERGGRHHEQTLLLTSHRSQSRPKRHQTKRVWERSMTRFLIPPGRTLSFEVRVSIYAN